jgi:cell division protein FtsN
MAETPQTPTSLDTSNEHTTTALYRAAIGPVNTEYYLTIFNRFEAANRASAQWNWASALNTINWMLFRKLWIPALAYTGCVLGVLLVVFGIGGLVFKFSDTARWVLSALFIAAAVILPGFYGTALFHNACRKKMEHALIHTATLADACVQLNRQASQRPRLLGVLLANLALLGIIIGIVAGLRRSDPTLDAELPEARNVAVGRAIEEAPAPAAPEVIPPEPQPEPETAPKPEPAAAEVPTLPPLPPLPESKPVEATTQPPAKPATATAAPRPAEPPQSAAQTPVSPEKKVSAEKTPAQTSTTTPSPSAAKQPSTPAKPAVAKVTAIATSAKETVYLINVGLFADENNARNAKTRLEDAGLTTVSEEIAYPRGKRTRVRVGPFATDTEANAAAEKIRNLGLEAAVFKQ